MEKLKKWNEFVQQQKTQTPFTSIAKQQQDDSMIKDLVNRSLARDPQFVSKASNLNPNQKMDLITKTSANILGSNPTHGVDITKINNQLASILNFDIQGAMNNKNANF